MRQLSDWNKFTMKVKQENPDMAFKDVLALAGKMKREGTDIVAYTKGMKVGPKKSGKKTGKKGAKKTGKKTKGKTRKNKSKKH